MEVLVAEIVINGRHRKDLGDVRSLADSIAAIGLLHPVVVTPENRLVVGERRIAAFKLLGRDKIPANVAKNLNDAKLLLDAERDENTCRKDFVPEEYVALGDALEKLYRPKAEAVAKAKQSAGGKSAGKSRPANSSGGTSPTPKKRDESARTSAVAAAAAGVDRRTYEKAKAVVKSGNRKLIDEMNKTGKVAGVHKRLVVLEKSAAIKKEPPPLPGGKYRVASRRVLRRNRRMSRRDRLHRMPAGAEHQRLCPSAERRCPMIAPSEDHVTQLQQRFWNLRRTHTRPQLRQLHRQLDFLSDAIGQVVDEVNAHGRVEGEQQLMPFINKLFHVKGRLIDLFLETRYALRGDPATKTHVDECMNGTSEREVTQ